MGPITPYPSDLPRIDIMVPQSIRPPEGIIHRRLPPVSKTPVLCGKLYQSMGQLYHPRLLQKLSRQPGIPEAGIDPSQGDCAGIPAPLVLLPPRRIHDKIMTAQPKRITANGKQPVQLPDPAPEASPFFVRICAALDMHRMYGDRRKAIAETQFKKPETFPGKEAKLLTALPQKITAGSMQGFQTVDKMSIHQPFGIPCVNHRPAWAFHIEYQISGHHPSEIQYHTGVIITVHQKAVILVGVAASKAGNSFRPQQIFFLPHQTLLHRSACQGKRDTQILFPYPVYNGQALLHTGDRLCVYRLFFRKGNFTPQQGKGIPHDRMFPAAVVKSRFLPPCRLPARIIVLLVTYIAVLRIHLCVRLPHRSLAHPERFPGKFCTQRAVFILYPRDQIRIPAAFHILHFHRKTITAPG